MANSTFLVFLGFDLGVSIENFGRSFFTCAIFFFFFSFTRGKEEADTNFLINYLFRNSAKYKLLYFTSSSFLFHLSYTP